MTTITITAIELNARRNGEACCNGVRVDTAELPALTGSVKQIAWAEGIRAKQIEALGRFAAKSIGLFHAAGLRADDLDTKVAQVNGGLAKLAAVVATRTDASWWIDRRSTAELALIQALAK